MFIISFVFYYFIVFFLKVINFFNIRYVDNYI